MYRHMGYFRGINNKVFLFQGSLSFTNELHLLCRMLTAVLLSSVTINPEEWSAKMRDNLKGKNKYT